MKSLFPCVQKKKKDLSRSISGPGKLKPERRSETPVGQFGSVRTVCYQVYRYCLF